MLAVNYLIPKVYVTGSNRLSIMGGDWGRRKRTRAVVREMSPNFTNALANYFGTGPTDLAASRVAHNNYIAALIEHGVEVDILPGIAENPDCTFVEDTAVIIEDVALIMNMGHPSREGEQRAVQDLLANHLTVVNLPGGAKMDGGDVIFFDDRLLVGRSTRTNDAGIEFVRKIAHEKGLGVMVFDVPSTTLHLTTVCSSPKPGMLIAAEGHLTSKQLQPLVEDGVEIIWIPNEESYAANVIGFEGGKVIISGNYPVCAEKLLAAGFDIWEVDMAHIRVADGSLTCCSIFYQ